MRWKIFSIIVLASVLTACNRSREPEPTATPGQHLPIESLRSLQEIQQRAVAYNSLISLPPFETTTNQIQTTLTNAIAAGNAALDQIGKLKPAEVTFTNTVGALDDLGFQLRLVDNRFALLKETSTNASLREAATGALKEFEGWMVGIDYRDDVYKAVKAYADTKPTLTGEDAKLLYETMRDYRRAGLELPRAERDEVERMRKELSGLGTDFESNINQAQRPVAFTRAELEGVPDEFLQEIRATNDMYIVMANITVHYIRVMDNARNETTRKRLLVEHDNLGRSENIPLLQKILVLRNDIAHKLGYKTAADFETEIKMVGNADTAIHFLEDLKTGLEPKFAAELEEFRQLKVKETGDPAAKIEVWDWRYFSNQLKKQRYNVDAEQLRVFFPYQRVLDGMFAIYQRIFGLKFEPVQPPYKWIGDLQLFAVSDAKTGEPLGLFYLDMFPREGKYHHFA